MSFAGVAFLGKTFVAKLGYYVALEPKGRTGRDEAKGPDGAWRGGGNVYQHADSYGEVIDAA